MIYTFPPSLYPLRDYLKGQGADTRAFVSARQAAFMAQQLLGTRVKFPDKGADMTSTLFLIQKAVTEKGIAMTATPSAPKGKKRKQKSPYANLKRNKPDFSPQVFAEGVHIFCDGASIPNPGIGGWGVVVYRDGIECASSHGGNAETTNNQMELMGLLTAIEMAEAYSDGEHPATIWCDSQYCVEGANVWLKTWKARGWNKKKPESPKRDEGGIKNLDLWQAIDRALSNTPVSRISIKWVKGHVGVIGNERADALAEQGRELFVERAQNSAGNELDERYRQIMGAV
ncbi:MULTISPECIES: ribonuclease H [unclassified Rhizobium]|uniref:ribonuclease H family protein n=1 Tax=unclassified Rhizobium TaxID=2613769 RepID=UPI000713A7E2|nr:MULTISPECIES: ribonuclease H [unclassified Rhizobium]KRA59013.1 hypothetical protein ASD85_15100 [Rhizobium sp. Root651]